MDPPSGTECTRDRIQDVVCSFDGDRLTALLQIDDATEFDLPSMRGLFAPAGFEAPRLALYRTAQGDLPSMWTVFMMIQEHQLGDRH